MPLDGMAWRNAPGQAGGGDHLFLRYVFDASA